jgi:predicted ferric reductase
MYYQFSSNSSFLSFRLHNIMLIINHFQSKKKLNYKKKKKRVKRRLLRNLFEKKKKSFNSNDDNDLLTMTFISFKTIYFIVVAIIHAINTGIKNKV